MSNDTEPDPRFVYGAWARAEALAADDPEWFKVTRWPVLDHAIEADQ